VQRRGGLLEDHSARLPLPRSATPCPRHAYRCPPLRRWYGWHQGDGQRPEPAHAGSAADGTCDRPARYRGGPLLGGPLSQPARKHGAAISSGLTPHEGAALGHQSGQCGHGGGAPAFGFRIDKSDRSPFHFEASRHVQHHAQPLPCWVSSPERSATTAAERCTSNTHAPVWRRRYRRRRASSAAQPSVSSSGRY
jgi:hypothetical protein